MQVGNTPIAKKHVYETIFNTEFNIGFHKPKKDQCSLCEEFKNSSQEEKEVIQAKYEQHVQEKIESRLEKEKDIQQAQNKSSIVAVFDFQSVTPLPSGQVSSFYYKRKLNLHNFTIYECVSKIGRCYMWHEGQAGRGANEVGSCLLLFLNQCENQNVVFYSDNCMGQNKNKYVASVYLYAVQHFQILTIRHKFLVVGHTQNEGDNMHSRIESEKQRALKSGPIYVPSQMATIASLARKTGNPYFVEQIDTSDIIDCKTLCSEVGNNFSVNEEGEKVIWNDISEIMVEKASPYVLFYKTSYKDKEYKQIAVTKRKRGKPNQVLSVQIKPAFRKQPKISAAKKKDLLSLCSQNLIPKVHHNFYNNLEAEKE